MIGLHREDAGYPRALRDLSASPDPLWIDGDPAVLERPCVAIVGTRRMTPYGERVARELAAALSRSGAVVVSGLAQGIDCAAHRSALAAGGASVAVLGEGITSFLANARGRRRVLATELRAHGALVSPWPVRHSLARQSANRWRIRCREERLSTALVGNPDTATVLVRGDPPTNAEHVRDRAAHVDRSGRRTIQPRSRMKRNETWLQGIQRRAAKERERFRRDQQADRSLALGSACSSPKYVPEQRDGGQRTGGMICARCGKRPDQHR